MEGQFGAPFHFAVEFLVLVVALGGAFEAIRARRSGAGAWSLGQAAGFLALAAGQFLHGALVAQADGNLYVIALRTFAFVMLAIAARPAVALEQAALHPMISAGAVPALFFVGTHASYALIPGFAALAVAARGARAHGVYRDRTTLAFTAAFVSFATAEFITATSASDVGLIASHAARVLGALLLAGWLWASIVRSVRLRFVAAFVAVLTIAVLIVSAALNVVIGNTLQNNELRRLDEAGAARATSVQNLGVGALLPAQLQAQSDTVRAAVRGKGPLPSLNGIVQLLNLDFAMLVDSHGKTLLSAQHLPSGAIAEFPATEDISIAGSSVVTQALQGTPGVSPASITFATGRGTVQTQMLVIAAYPVGTHVSGRSGTTIFGAVIDGYRIDRPRLLEVKQDTGAEATILAGDRVAGTTFATPAKVAQAFDKIDFSGPRENGTSLQRLVSIAGSQYVSAFVPIHASDGSVVGLLGLSRKSTALAEAQRNVTRTLFIITLVVVLLAALLAWASGGRVTRPIRALTAAARQLRAGQFQARAQVASLDEVGTLGTAFNEMADELQRQTGQLQRSAATEATLRARMEAILQSMSDGLIATDGAGTIVTFNRAAEQLLGRRAQGSVRKPLADVMDGRTSGGHLLAEAASLGGATEGTLRRPDGSTIPVALTSAPLLDSQGSHFGRVVLIRDISTEREAERMKSEFLANVSHELRTPITPIRGYAEIMTRKKFPRSKEVTFLQGIIESTEKLERVVEMLVDFAAMEAGRLKPRILPVPVRGLLDEITGKWRARDNDHQFVRKIDPAVPAVLGDVKMISRSLDELLDNAVKFSPDGGKIEVIAEPYVNGSRSRRPSRVRITVRDHGIGIEPEHVPELFQDFRQIDGGDTRTFGGLGLGLAYVKRIASVHGGDVTVESTPGEGSSFSLVLPAADAADVKKAARARPKR